MNTDKTLTAGKSGDLLRVTPAGLYCEAGGFFIDPQQPVSRAVITHAHADHARTGHKHYFTTRCGLPVLQPRMLANAKINTFDYGEPIDFRGVRVSLHPAGHILGSAQIRVEHAGEVWVVSGDYRCEADATCAPFEAVVCDTFITECTFGEPHFAWRPQAEIMTEIQDWWRKNQSTGVASLLFVYSLGKAQRILHAIDPGIGPILVHGAVAVANSGYRAAGVHLPHTWSLADPPSADEHRPPLVLAPPSAMKTRWHRRLGAAKTAFASGWMLLPGATQRYQVDRGFVLSDHADYRELHQAVQQTKASRVLAMHGNVDPFVQSLQSLGIAAAALPTLATPPKKTRR